MKRRSANRKKKLPITPPKNVPPSQNQAPTVGGALLGNLALGATLGAGSSLGNRAVDTIMSSSNNNESNPKTNVSMDCTKLLEMMDTCLRNQNANCDFLTDMVNKKCNV